MRQLFYPHPPLPPRRPFDLFLSLSHVSLCLLLWLVGLITARTFPDENPVKTQ